MSVLSADERHDLFGGTGRVLVSDLMGKTRLDPFRAVLACELAPGGSVGKHVQAEFAEIVVVLDGSGGISVDDQRRAVGPGDLVALPLGATLAIENGSTDAPMRYLIIKAG